MHPSSKCMQVQGLMGGSVISGGVKGDTFHCPIRRKLLGSRKAIASVIMNDVTRHTDTLL